MFHLVQRAHFMFPACRTGTHHHLSELY